MCECQRGLWTYHQPTKLFILDVKPRSTAKGVGPEILTAYGVEGGERTLPEEFGVYELR